MKKTFACFAALLMAVMMVFSACGSKPAEEAQQGLTPINVSHHPYIHGLPTAVAIEQGFYEANGLAPEVTMYAGGAAQNEACATNAWDVGTTGMAGAVVGLIGYDMKVIGVSASESATIDLWVRPDSPIAALAGQVEGYPDIKGNAETWKGSTVICQSASNCHLVLLATLEKMGLTADDIKMVDMSVAQCYPAFKSGEGDVVALWSPFGYQAEKEGWIKVSSAQALGLEFCNVILATDKAIAEKPEAVQAWLQTYQQGADYISAHKDEAAGWLYNFSMDEGITTTEENCALEINNRPFPTVEEQKDMICGGKLEDLLLVFADFLRNQGNITDENFEKLASGACIDTSFVENLK